MPSRIEVVDRECACGCGALIPARSPRGKLTYRRFLMGHQNHGVALSADRRAAVSDARRREFEERYPDGVKVCPRCETSHPLEDFFFGGKWREVCVTCHREVTAEDGRQRWAADPEVAKRKMQMRKYGLTEEQYLIEVAKTICGSCGAAGRELVFDHDHATGRYRGRICRSCNYLLGVVRDDPQRLRNAADYLERQAVNV